MLKRQERHNEGTLTAFNNNKSIALQDGGDMNTRGEETCMRM